MEPVFVVAAERSGTTMFWQMLDQHPALAFVTLGEFQYAIEPVGDDGTRPTAAEFQAFAAENFEWAMSAKTFDPAESYDTNAHRWLHEAAAEGVAPGAVIHRHADRIPHLWPKARYLHLLRDGRLVAASRIRLGWEQDLWHAVEDWMRAEEQIAALRAKVGDDAVLTIRYRDLVTDPTSVLTHVCEFLGIEPLADLMLSYADLGGYDVPDAAKVDVWRSWPAADLRLVEARAGAMLEARGYPLSGQPTTPPTPLELAALNARRKVLGLRRAGADHGVLTVAGEVIGSRLRMARLRRWAAARRIRSTAAMRTATVHDETQTIGIPLDDA